MKFLFKSAPVTFAPDELEIIRLICEQDFNEEIATKLLISQRVMERMLKRIKSKMKVKGTVGIVIYAIKNGIINCSI